MTNIPDSMSIEEAQAALRATKLKLTSAKEALHTAIDGEHKALGRVKIADTKLEELRQVDKEASEEERAAEAEARKEESEAKVAEADAERADADEKKARLTLTVAS